jgi:type III secretory pathway lipoprotein EscJ
LRSQAGENGFSINLRISNFVFTTNYYDTVSFVYRIRDLLVAALAGIAPDRIEVKSSTSAAHGTAPYELSGQKSKEREFLVLLNIEQGTNIKFGQVHNIQSFLFLRGAACRTPSNIYYQRAKFQSIGITW